MQIPCVTREAGTIFHSVTRGTKNSSSLLVGGLTKLFELSEYPVNSRSGLSLAASTTTLSGRGFFFQSVGGSGWRKERRNSTSRYKIPHRVKLPQKRPVEGVFFRRSSSPRPLRPFNVSETFSPSSFLFRPVVSPEASHAPQRFARLVREEENLSFPEIK